jgi:hypothetical protein
MDARRRGDVEWVDQRRRIKPMPKRPSLPRRGRHTVLPIEGSLLAEVCLAISRLVALVFRDAEGNEAEVTVEDKIVLARGTDERVLEGSRPGTSFDPKGLHLLIDLLGSRVCEATARDTGELRITFADGLVLEVASTTGYEAWHFAKPPPGRPAGGSGPRFAITGAAGRLI